MGDAAISALVKDVIGRLTSIAIQEYWLVRGLANDLSALNNTFTQIQAVLHDAEMKQTSHKDVEAWLKTLKSASLEVENVLDEASTEAMLHSHDIGLKYKVKAFFSSHHNPLMVKTRIAHKVKNIRKKLDVIDANRSKFKLTSNTISEDAARVRDEFPNKETSSLVHLSSKIFGRDAEMKMMVDKICNQDLGAHDDGDSFRVYAIWGMGGIGKTTLAQVVYNHQTVNTNFELKFWVYVSNEFDVRKMIKSICDVKDSQLDAMLVSLQNKLRGKKFFIVLDDVWIENKEIEMWDELCKAFSCGAKGSTLMVTTQKWTTCQMMAKIPEMQHNVGVLSEEDSWSLFKMLAFPGGREGGNLRELELIGRKIVEKCEGLPLALKTLGSLMSSKSMANQWNLVNDNIMWEMQENGILPALRLSYDNLLPHMKRCFAYCCLFSKGKEMSKELLIELWMANNFIPPKGEISLYVLGEEIFNCLVWRSFFQVVKGDDDEGAICKMHDLMHDLAHHVMRDDCLVIESGRELITTDEVLHLGSSCEFHFSKQDLNRLRSLRSMLVFYDHQRSSNIIQISNHAYLRVLYLQHIEGPTLPESICELIHLRYLKISDSNIRALPESIIYLQNLQVLVLKSCYCFRVLPNGMRYMRNLRRLETDSNKLHHMPVGIKELANLRRLSRFAVGKKDGARIGELGNLNLLGRELTLLRLENVGGLRDAKSANLKDKTNLKILCLDWSRHDRQETFDTEVLEGLEPNSGLQKLSIFNYLSTIISPSWLVKLQNLTHIRFHYVKNCEHLPPLGKLPSLEIISLVSMRSLKCFRDDDNDTSRDSILFPSLRKLHIDNCPYLESLPTNFPKLRFLDISLCNRLRSLPDEIESFKDLNYLHITQCEILSKRCENEIGEDWHKISHIPHLDIRPPKLRRA
ncbi:Disease resistance protein [Artemisia annua]|uniref:Disease resistance protein n=1 Tax=Artemisia annua TaxID=35608 RepID=A0A2U1KZM9_ARTAN|nr:Disease resistance protein [Artemisia annua]